MLSLEGLCKWVGECLDKTGGRGAGYFGAGGRLA